MRSLKMVELAYEVGDIAAERIQALIQEEIANELGKNKDTLPSKYFCTQEKIGPSGDESHLMVMHPIEPTTQGDKKPCKTFTAREFE
jgi:hypothetical protein